jgi:hypothetical protein
MTTRELHEQLIVVLNYTVLALKAIQSNNQHAMLEAIRAIRQNVDELQVCRDWQRIIDING